MSRGIFENNFGYFTEEGDEYIITRPDTPRPWVNVISNGQYGLIISQAGGGYSWHTHATLNRLTRWEQDLIRDEWGKYIYLRDNEAGTFWSLAWKPVCRLADWYECRHGIGYTVISSVNEGIKTSATFFVPSNDTLEIWLVKIKNLAEVPRNLSLFTYLEWCLGVAPDWHREFHRCFVETKFYNSIGGIIATKRLWDLPKTRWNRSWDYIAFHTVCPPPEGFECDKEAFLGIYGSPARPRAVVEGTTYQTSGNWVDPIGCLKVEVKLEPYEEKEFVFLLGATKELEEIERLVAKYGNVQGAKAAFEKTRYFWRELLGSLWVETPDKAFNILNNWWLKYQAISGRFWGRTGYYQPAGAYGFRDQLQDSQVFLLLGRPEFTLEHLRLCARHQFCDGSVLHWWHPIVEDGVKINCSDDFLWLPYILIQYLKATGNFSALKIEEPYLDGDKESLYMHCIRAIDLALSRFSSRGLPLIGEGDWNDAMNAVGVEMKGESIWLAHFLYLILMEFGELAVKLGDDKVGRRYLSQAEQLKQAVNQYAWDGEWYIRATDDKGNVLGSKICSEGKIFLNAQTWAVISGIAPLDRARTAMNAVEQLLEQEYGPLLLWPAYERVNSQIGYLTRYTPGVRENGGVYMHAAAWAILAECLLGRAEAAYRMYCKVNPIKRSLTPELYKAEPYVVPGSVDGPQSPNFGRGGWTWYTGSAAWLLKVGLEGILGLRPTYEGLICDPCIPPEWEGFKVRYPFRGAIYEIEVKNPYHTGRGIQNVVVDGTIIRTNLIPVFSDGRVHTVHIALSKKITNRS